MYKCMCWWSLLVELFLYSFYFFKIYSLHTVCVGLHFESNFFNCSIHLKHCCIDFWLISIFWFPEVSKTWRSSSAPPRTPRHPVEAGSAMFFINRKKSFWSSVKIFSDILVFIHLGKASLLCRNDLITAEWLFLKHDLCQLCIKFLLCM